MLQLIPLALSTFAALPLCLQANGAAAERGREPRSPWLIVSGFVLSYALAGASQLLEETSPLRIALLLPACLVLMATVLASKGRAKPAKSTDAEPAGGAIASKL